MTTATKVEQMNIVIVGHVDHGKSTFIGRLLADTDSLPTGKLEQVRKMCEINAKPFEYAFLLDALKDEQAQGITIDTARCFFKTDKRHYIVLDAPGHIEFLKNMITGAARAEAAVLLIDAKEGVQENSKRHGYMLSLLGIKQFIVLVNKMDLVDYDQTIYNNIVSEYTAFLKDFDAEPLAFVPISAFNGETLISASDKMPWYSGKPVLDLIDDFVKEKEAENQPFRFPVQDIYKFTKAGDDRRIVAGTVETGHISVGDKVIFYPSQKRSKVSSIEVFNSENPTTVSSGESTGFTLETQIYIQPGEVMVKESDALHPSFGHSFKANIFWLGKQSLKKDKKYKLKIGTSRSTVVVTDILNVMDASKLAKDNQKSEVGRHEVAECIFQTTKPIAFDLAQDLSGTSRFVIIDDYEITGGGIITQSVETSDHITDTVEKKSFAWESNPNQGVSDAEFVVVTGPAESDLVGQALSLEADYRANGKQVLYRGLSNRLSGGTTETRDLESRLEHLRRLSVYAEILTQAGVSFITSIPELTDNEIEQLTLFSGVEVRVYTG